MGSTLPRDKTAGVQCRSETSAAETVTPAVEKPDHSARYFSVDFALENEQFNEERLRKWIVDAKNAFKTLHEKEEKQKKQEQQETIWDHLPTPAGNKLSEIMSLSVKERKEALSKDKNLATAANDECLRKLLEVRWNQHEDDTLKKIAKRSRRAAAVGAGNSSGAGQNTQTAYQKLSQQYPEFRLERKTDKTGKPIYYVPRMMEDMVPQYEDESEEEAGKLKGDEKKENQKDKKKNISNRENFRWSGRERGEIFLPGVDGLNVTSSLLFKIPNDRNQRTAIVEENTKIGRLILTGGPGRALRVNGDVGEEVEKGDVLMGDEDVVMKLNRPVDESDQHVSHQDLVPKHADFFASVGEKHAQPDHIGFGGRYSWWLEEDEVSKKALGLGTKEALVKYHSDFFKNREAFLKDKEQQAKLWREQEREERRKRRKEKKSSTVGFGKDGEDVKEKEVPKGRAAHAAGAAADIEKMDGTSDIFMTAANEDHVDSEEDTKDDDDVKPGGPFETVRDSEHLAVWRKEKPDQPNIDYDRKTKVKPEVLDAKGQPKMISRYEKNGPNSGFLPLGVNSAQHAWKADEATAMDYVKGEKFLMG